MNVMESFMTDRSNIRLLKRRRMKLWSASKMKYFISIATPFLLSPLAASANKESQCAFIMLWMSVYWVLEPVDLSATALMPVVLMPLFGIVDSNEIVKNYMKDVLLMFVGGLGVAIAVEHCNLHERIALKVLITIGSDTKWLMFGFMLTSMFLSMWISNTATTAMMVPIIGAIIKELKRRSVAHAKDEIKINILYKTLLLSVAYAANCGGTGTITGTSPNMVFKGYVEEFYPESSEITYASWMAYNIPGMVLCVLSGWVVLQVAYAPCWHKQDEGAKKRIKAVIASRYNELGKITFHEYSVMILFLVLVLLWVFREPKFMTGWADLLATNKKIGDAVPAIGILLLMFLLPTDPWRPHKSPRLLTWPIFQRKLPWGLVLLLGGGYALANGAQNSGLSAWLGEVMAKLSFLSPSVVLIILCIATAALTEVMSNSTVTTILLPVVRQMAGTFKINPLYLMLPLTVASSYAFMLPVATGPNAIVFGTGCMTTTDMIKPGIFMNIIACIIQLFMIHTLGTFMFNLHDYPYWANANNITLLMNTTKLD